ncbi:Glutamate 5-kinase / RNA-binding C-terminal domain PUA [hydrothermal vent metagenome]|uniref:Glutamate 5-kinase / RNA-binding C-terminal domain PUA n=1 Tax=hydrothermal vent metagenome TaxID=652676 RepID=A0A3B0UC38_9ZZZZ
MDAVKMSSPLDGYKRLTIKIGSSLLIDAQTGRLRQEWLNSLATDIASLREQNKEIIVVSSGAILLGRRLLGITTKTLPLSKIQATASVGQVALAQAWRTALDPHNITIGQILLTPNITEERQYYINARATISTLISFGSVPIINENDSVATAEIRYGDNDRLSARVASMLGADCLILLSDVDGLYTAPPETNKNARHLARVETINADIERMARGPASFLARGGMVTKIEAAKIATQSGTAMIITMGNDHHPLKQLSNGARHTIFSASQSPAAARKRWILATLDIAGTISVDHGAAQALLSGKSLLPIGVVKVTGDFLRGDAVSIVGPDNKEIARGLAGMNKDDAKQALGKKSPAIVGMFGNTSRTEMVHADNLVLLSSPD